MKPKTLNLLCILLFILLVLLFSCSKEEQPRLTPPDVPVYQTKEQEIPIYEEFVGQVYGFKDIAIAARVEGFLEIIHFQEGSRIKKGDLLYTVESQPFEANVAAKMSMVAEAQTMLAKAQSDLNRIRPLAEQRAVSQSDLDGAVAQYEAFLEQVKAAKANLKAARIQLSYTRICSPISGIIGKTRAKVGDLVGKNPNPIILNVVSSIDTVLVDFFITETQYLEVVRYLAAQRNLEEDKRSHERLKLWLILVDGSLYKHQGKIDFMDRQVDPTTGSMLLQASFPNPDNMLRPGQFARVKVEVEVVKDAILVPQRCIMELQATYSVYVVNDSNEVETRDVTVGPKIKDFWLIRKGLKPGEKVVYEGLQKVKAGIIVNPVIQDINLTITEKQ